MTNLKLTMLAAAAIGTAMIGSASAMPLNGLKALQGESLVQDVRIICNQWGQCYNTRNRSRTWYSSRHNRQRYAQPYYGQPYYGYHQPRAGISFGPFGIYAR